MTIALKGDKKRWYQLHEHHMMYEDITGKTVKYTRHKSETLEEFTDRMIRILVSASQGRKLNC